ncbi:Sulfotransferase 1C2-like [Oopsacas minuta]|uniref:Sulfotransferase 1C2-like n=1 Tax=Oopsacas minuta TaxID=111878 RepID=A0AAV7JWB7_9METZ|nr:Sulfotransferase 1C2-like [Oopsacas minuta]
MAQECNEKSVGRSKLLVYKGYYFPPISTASWIEEVQTTFKVRNTDIFITSMFKCGTHWLAHIIELLKSNKKLSAQIHDRTTFLEIPMLDELPEDMSQYGALSSIVPMKSEIAKMPAPRVFTTHFPFELLPFNPSAKYLYIYRNPKDVVLSAYNHFAGVKHRTFEGSFNDFFNYYLHTDFLGYFRHMKSYFEHKHLPNLYILSYEELHRDFNTKLEEIASFLNYDLTADLYQMIVKETNFETMQNNQFINNQFFMQEGRTFLNKGKVGYWKDSLTDEQSRKMEELLNEKLGEDFVRENILFEI